LGTDLPITPTVLYTRGDPCYEGMEVWTTI